MAAGQGYIEFATGDVLTAAAANGYLASQVVMVFASAAARTSGIASPQEGMISYLKDTNSTEYYSGSAWVAIGGSSGTTFSGCKLTRSSAQSIPDGTLTAILFDTETFDVGGYHSTSTNTSRVTIPSGKAGYYLLTAATYWDASSSGYRRIRYGVNGSSTTALDTYCPGFSTANSGMATTIVNLAVGDYVEMYVSQTSGGSLNTNWGNDGSFSVAYLGA